VTKRRWALGHAGYWMAVAAGAGMAAGAVDTTPAGALDADDLVVPALAQLAALLYAGLSVLVAVMWLVGWWRLKSGRRWAWATALVSILLAFPGMAMTSAVPGMWKLPVLVGFLVMPILGMVTAGGKARPSR